MLPAPGFHHPHLNSIDPDAAVEFLHQTVPARVAKLRGEGVRFLEGPYTLGYTRAVMIEGPSREALELVEVA